MNKQELLENLKEIGFLNLLEGLNKSHTEITIDFNGSGDEGWIESAEVAFDPDGKIFDVYKNKFHHIGYEILQQYEPGWEINEGSFGKINIEIFKEKEDWNVKCSIDISVPQPVEEHKELF